MASITYNAQQPTANVALTYDSSYPRLSTMADGIGTTTYSYYPVSTTPALGANQLKSVVSPIASSSGSDTVAYSYDALNRIIGTTVNGAAQSTGFDALGRVNAASNPLDSFTYSYMDATFRVSGVTSNLGPTAAMSYYGPTGDELLQQVAFTTNSGGISLSQFGYTYNADDNVKSTTLSSPSAQTSNYAYDSANRLLSSTLSGTSTPQYAYGYDPATNLLSITANGSQQSYTYSSINTITAGTYNNNGSPIVLGGNTYTWDGANRVLTYANAASSTSSAFTYNGMGQLVRVIDYHNSSVVADHSYTWCGAAMCLAHDNTQSGSPVSAQYFTQGVISSSMPYYYVTDRLGSVIQMINTAGNIAAQYSYDPYGNRTTVSGNLSSAIGYAGYFYSATSGLDFTLNRAYDPTHARWLNRDPIGEAGGINLYAYVQGNPLTLLDPLGTGPLFVTPFEEILLGIAEAIEPVVGAVFAYAPSVGGVAAFGYGLGYVIDYFCPSCEQFGESVGGYLYNLSNSYNQISTSVPSSPPPLLTLPGPSDVVSQPFVPLNTIFSPCQ